MGSANVSERMLQPPQVGVSVVVLSLGPDSGAHRTSNTRSQLWLPLVRRVRQPFLGAWALPGGDLRADRSLEQSAYLTLASTTDLHPQYLEQLYTFGDVHRSQGGLPMISIAYWALVRRDQTSVHEDIENVTWFPESDLPTLAFDHRDIIDYALTRLRSRIEYPDIATKLVGDTFTLRQLHQVYEAVIGQAIDLANFRRKMLTSGELEPTGEKRREGKQRPAGLYRYAAAEILSRSPSAFQRYSGHRYEIPHVESARANHVFARSSSDPLSALTTTAR